MNNNLVPWEPFRELMDTGDIFDRFFRPTKFLWDLKGDSYGLPKVDIIDKKDRIIAKAELPGVDKKDIKLTLEDEYLTIKGELKKEDEVKEKDYYRCERSYGSFSRSIALPVSVDKENAKASYKKGILTIDLPKNKEGNIRGKEISID
ncbi:Hsp20/alpha crystallin family protein [Elusimicrobiota bacterium]